MLSNLASIELTEQAELLRLRAMHCLDPARQAMLGQFFTPAALARLMGTLLPAGQPQVSLLDAGAGVGSLLAAGVEALLRAEIPPQVIHVTAYELDTMLQPFLMETLEHCTQACRDHHVEFAYTVVTEDFVSSAVNQLCTPLFNSHVTPFNAAIINPPYHKLRSDSHHRRLLRSVGIETSNLYTAFLALVVKLLAPEGKMVAVTPRSFCNGPYFRPFRQLLLQETQIRELHLFQARDQVFQEDNVLQENIVLVVVKSDKQHNAVQLVMREHAEDDLPLVRIVPYGQVVHPDDPELFIRCVLDSAGQQVAEQVGRLTATLDDLGVTVSTGRVVDFRAASFLRSLPEAGTTALIYPAHLEHGVVIWPKMPSKKPNAIVHCGETAPLLVPNEWYVLVKRFSAKEEPRRVVAAMYDPNSITADAVGFENHLNYYHVRGRGLDPIFAHGLATFLNSSLVDLYVRQFNGHTQVNATDLRRLRYPSRKQLLAIGKRVMEGSYTAQQVDTLIAEELFVDAPSEEHPLQIQQRVGEALRILRELGFPRQQLNERSALTLLALLDLLPHQPWTEAQNPLLGITPMMTFFAKNYGKQYKPNTRETVRRQTVHQFLDAGLVLINPDSPERPVNSPKAVYQIEPAALTLLRSFNTPEWSRQLYNYLAEVGSLRQRYAQERAMERIPLQLPGGGFLTLSPGGQNLLIKQIVDEFAPRFVPGGQVVYIGDADEKFVYFDEGLAHSLDITVEAHGKMPDVMLYHSQKDWLILVEAVTSHGPIDPKRKAELVRLFATARPGLVYVTAFLSRQALRDYLQLISWETEVWIAEAPSHLIHFNGERFLGPYDA